MRRALIWQRGERLRKIAERKKQKVAGENAEQRFQIYVSEEVHEKRRISDELC
jgi:hypothetical protein